MALPRPVAERLIGLACYAPSVHNTQPWLWQVDGDRIRLFADRSRQLAEEDPDGRNLFISCGAALHHLQYAGRALGWAADVTRLPQPDQPDLVAEVRLTRGEPAAQPAEDLAALRSRCTDRRRFTSWPVPDAVLDRLAEEAREWDAGAFPVIDVVARFRLELLAGEAVAMHERNDDAIREQARWVGRGADEGVPLAVLPGLQQEALDRPNRFGTGQADETRTAVESGDGVIVLGGATDDPAGWVRTGEALSALWLRATRDGLSVIPVSLPVEIPETRARLTTHVLGGAILPHLVVRIGWQAIGRSGLPRTPRRPVESVILPDPRT